MSKIFICLLFAINFFSFSQSQYQSREEKLEQLKSRQEIKFTEIEPNILKIEYPNGKVLYKNIGDYQPSLDYQHPTTYSPYFDSTIIDLTTIDTSLYCHKYRFWQEVPLTNFDFNHLRIGDVNNNGKTELYGSRKFFETPQEPITIYELNNNNVFTFTYQYDSVGYSWNIYDYDNDGRLDVHFLGFSGDQRFFIKENENSFATILKTSFIPYDSTYQVNDPKLGDFDGDQNTELLFAAGAGRGSMHIFEYNMITNTFDSVYRYQIREPRQLEVSGFSVSDFDLDGKTDIVFGTGSGAVHVVENQGNNQFDHVWLGYIESYSAYIHTWSNDIDENGKPEFWVLGDAYYGGIPITKLTIFETNGNNSYQAVGRVDLVGVFSFYAGTLQAVDIDHDGIDEIAVCIDDNFLILKFVGSRNHHTYEVFYIKKNELSANGENSVYFGSVLYDLLNNGEENILISMDHIINIGGGNVQAKRFTQIYKPDSTLSVKNHSTIYSEFFKLSQNYPNPFNPTTKISWQSPVNGQQTLKVYDVLGREVATLVDEYREAGSYEVEFDATNLPSGMYIYRLQSGSYSDVKKMILSK